MRQSGPLRHELRRAGVCALLLPFVLLSMLAAGTMPVRAASGQVELVICAGDTLVTVTVPAHRAPPGEPRDAHRGCVWDDAARPLLAIADVTQVDAPSRLVPMAFSSVVRTIDMRRRTGPVANRGPPPRI